MMEEEEDTLFDQEGLLGNKHSARTEASDKQQKIFKTAALALSFFSLGCCVAIPGATLLDLGQRVGKDTEHMTFIATARSAGYLIGAVFGGVMSDFFDHQVLLFYTLVLTSIATTVIPWCTILITLTAMIGVQGLALGVLDTGGNVFCVRIWGKKSPPYMQFLHFSFAIGAFLAPLIAHPFLLNSISEISVNSSLSENTSIIAMLPYATSVQGRKKRDLPFANNPVFHFKGAESQLSSHRSFKSRRQAVSPITDAMELTHKAEGDNSSMTTNMSKKNESVNLPSSPVHQVETTTVRAKKPEVVAPLSKKHADGGLITDKLKDLKNAPFKEEGQNEDDDGGEEEKGLDEIASTVTTVVSVLNNGSANVSYETSSKNTSDNTSSGKGGEKLPLSTMASTSSSVFTASLTTSTIASTSSPTTTTTTTTISTTKSSEKSETSSDMVTVLSTNASTYNSSSSSNDTIPNKPGSLGDLIYGMLDTMRHMSKIQFAYLIIGFFLIGAAGFFLGLYCKDKLTGYRLLADTHEDLTRPPYSPCFVGVLLIALFFFLLFYVGMEQTYGILLTTFAVEFPDTVWTPAEGATLTAAFWGCVALGRGISICVSRFFKAPCMLVSNLMLIVIGGLLLSFILRSSWVILWVGTVFLGLGMSSLFPTIISWTNSYYPLTGKATAVFVAGSGVGQMTIPVLTGYLYQNVDRMSLMYMVFSLSILLCFIYTFLQIVASRRGSGEGISRSHSGFMRLHTSEDMADSLDMDLIQAGSMDSRPVRTRGENSHGKENGVRGDFEVTEFSNLVELSD